LFIINEQIASDKTINKEKPKMIAIDDPVDIIEPIISEPIQYNPDGTQKEEIIISDVEIIEAEKIDNLRFQTYNKKIISEPVDEIIKINEDDIISSSIYQPTTQLQTEREIEQMYIKEQPINLVTSLETIQTKKEQIILSDQLISDVEKTLNNTSTEEPSIVPEEGIILSAYVNQKSIVNNFGGSLMGSIR
jgi:hypothetical protein